MYLIQNTVRFQWGKLYKQLETLLETWQTLHTYSPLLLLVLYSFYLYVRQVHVSAFLWGIHPSLASPKQLLSTLGKNWILMVWVLLLLLYHTMSALKIEHLWSLYTFSDPFCELADWFLSLSCWHFQFLGSKTFVLL